MDTKARSRKVHLILNGKAAGNDALRVAIVQQREVGHRIEVRVTRKKGDARRFVSEASEVEVLIAAGGDGTLNEVVHGLMDLSMDARPALGVVPLGTANDFATGCGIPHEPEKALALCMDGDAIPIDVGKANDHWFLNVASVGFGAEVTATTSPELKRLLGSAAYAVMGAILATNVHQYQGGLILPDREITGSGPVAIVGNGRQTGGGVQVAPRACIDDGLLDVLVVDRAAHRCARIATALTGWRVYLLLADSLGRGLSRRSDSSQSGWRTGRIFKCPIRSGTEGDSTDRSAELSITIGNRKLNVFSGTGKAFCGCSA